MKNILYYFYLLSFLGLAGAGIAALFGPKDSFGFIILWQLVWGPISLLHCIYKFAVNFQLKTRLSTLYTISFVLTILYFTALALLSSSGLHIDMIPEDTLFAVGIIIVPWLMLAFFTYILWLEKKENLMEIG